MSWIFHRLRIPSVLNGYRTYDPAPTPDGGWAFFGVIEAALESSPMHAPDIAPQPGAAQITAPKAEQKGIMRISRTKNLIRVAPGASVAVPLGTSATCLPDDPAITEVYTPAIPRGLSQRFTLEAFGFAGPDDPPFCDGEMFAVLQNFTSRPQDLIEGETVFILRPKPQNPTHHAPATLPPPNQA